MAIKFSQFNLRTDHTSGMYLVGYDGNQNIHITVDNLFDDFINGTENTIAMFGTDGTALADSILSQDAGATLLTVAGQLNVDSAATFDTSITVTGDSTLNGNVTLGDASTDLITQTGTLYLNGPVKDTTDTLGAVDQVLLSDATGELTFTDLAGLHVGGAEVVEVPVKNAQGSALVKGDPVYISGSVGASGRLEVQLADASNALKMPAVGLLKQDLANNAEGFAVVTGKLKNLITDPIDGVNPTENDVIYVKPSGTSGAALTTTKPVYGNFIQNIGKVGRVSTSNDGNLVVSSILRTNDIPNLTPGRLWIGSTGNTIESQTLFVDEANGRLGIGTTTPDQNLTINGGTESFGLQVSESDRMTMGADGDWNYIKGKNGNGFRFSTFSGGDVLTLTNAGNVGIGTVSPAKKLHVEGEARINNNASNIQFVGTDHVFLEFYPRTISSGRKAYLGYAAHSTTNFTIMNQDTGGFIIGTNNSEKLRILSTGNVGIGTTNPISKLNVVNGSSGQSYSNVSGVLIDVNGTSNSYYGLRVGSNTGNNHFCVTNAGNVGIGTASPGEKLHVVGNIQINDHDGTGNLQIGASDGAGNDAIIGMAARNSSNGISPKVELKTIYDSSGGTNGSAFTISTRSGSGLSEKMRIDSSGNVSVGTTSTFTTGGTAKFTVAGNIMSFGSSNSDMSYLRRIAAGEFQWQTYNNANTGAIHLQPYGGNVGIGTTSPGAKLDVNGEVRFNTNTGTTPFYVTRLGSIGESLKISVLDQDAIFESIQDESLDNYGGFQFRLDSGTTEPDFQIRKGSNPALFLVNGGGNVGIGTTSPNTKLDVQRSSNGIALELHQNSGSANDFVDMKMVAGNTSAGNFGTILRHARQGTGGGDFAILTNPTLTGTPVERLRVTNAGNVGIGTTSPGEKLHVAGNIRVGNSTDTIYSNRFKGINNADVELRANNGYDLILNGSSGDNVGIGTTSPSFKTTIYSDSTTDSFPLVVGQPNAANEFVGIGLSGFVASNGAVKAGFVLDRKNTYGVGDIHILNNTTTDNSNATLADSKFTILQNNNVGIGTTSPADKLHVYSNDSSTIAGLTLEQDGTGDSVIQYLLTGIKRWVTGIDNSDGDKFKISHNTDLSTDNVATFTADNRVGIGTTSPETPLHVLTNTTDNASAMLIQNGSTGDASIKFNISGDTYSIGIDNSDSDKFKLSYGAVGTNDRIVVDTSGNIGIGTASPAKKLHVEGEVRINNNGGNVQFVGTDHVYLGFYPRTISSGRKAYLGYAANSTTDFTIMNEDNGAFIIGTNNSEKLRILSTGNVGIGTTTPGAKLDVNGEVRFNTNTGTTPFYVTRLGSIGESLKISVLDQDAIFESIQDESLDNYGGFQFRLDSGTTEPDFQIRKGTDPALFLVNGGGNVGIGTTSPSAGLNIVKSGLAAQLRISTTEADSTIKYGAIVGSHYTNAEEPIAGILMTSSSSATGGSVSIGGGISAANAVNDIIFYTATNNTTLTGSERMRIDSSGNIGIGTTSPSGKIHLLGAYNSQFFTQSTGGTTNKFGITSGTDYAAFTVGSSLTQAARFYHDNSYITFAENGANVGIGTTSPVNKLDVAGNIGIDQYLLHNGDVNTFFGFPGNDAASIGTNGTERIRVTSTGAVGIGTTNPSTKLQVEDVNAGGVFDALLLTNKSTTAGTSTKLKFVNSTDAASTSNTNYINSVRNAGSDNDLIFGTSNSDRMTIDSSGNVGIGTTSPGEKLEVNGTIKTSTGLIKGANASAYINLDGAVGSRLRYGNQYLTANATNLVFSTNNNVRMIVTNAGDVGIGTTTPASKLDVNGGIRMADDSSTASASNVGTLRYRTSGNNSYVDMCMQTGASTYAWVNIVQNNW